MTPLLLAAILTVTPAPRERCPRVVCTSECWGVSVKYLVNTAPPGSVPVYVTGIAEDAGEWGSVDGARCRADQIAREGIWLEADEHVPGAGPEKVAPGAVELLRVVSRPF